jgi:hypothetical protein
MTPFARVLESMRESLHLTRSDLYKPAGLTKEYYSKIIRRIFPIHPSKTNVFSFGFVLVRKDVRINTPPVIPPEERMNLLLEAADFRRLGVPSPNKEDLAVLACIERRIYNISTVQMILEYINSPMKDLSSENITLIKKIKVWIRGDDRYKHNLDFPHILTNMRKNLGIKPSELCRAAGLHRDYVSKILGEEPGKPRRHEKPYIFLLGFGLINIDIEKNKGVASMEPKERMDKLLASAGYSPLESPDFEDNAAILFCVENGIYNIDSVNDILTHRGLSRLPVSCL